MRKGLFFSLFGLLIGIVNSCSGLLGEKGITEGVIEYDITYPSLDPNNMMVSTMPNKAYLRFKNNNTSNEMSDIMGLFSITVISNQKIQSVEQRITLISIKQTSTVSSADLRRLNASYVSSIEEGKGVTEIAGFKCKEALVKLMNGEQIKVYYTNDIGIENPNWSNPYSKIKGVLMDFQMERYRVTMHLKATSVLKQKIDDVVFASSADSTEYKRVPFSDMEKMLEGLSPASD